MENKIGRYVGIVKRWDHERCFGFIAMLSKDRHLTKEQLVFIHSDEIKEEYKNLFEEQVVEFDLYQNSINDKKTAFKAREMKQIRSGYKLFSGVSRGSEF